MPDRSRLKSWGSGDRSSLEEGHPFRATSGYLKQETLEHYELDPRVNLKALFAGALNAAVLALVAFGLLLPVVLMLAGSLRPVGLPPEGGFQWFRGPPQWQNYLNITFFVPLWRPLLNSLFVVAVAVPVSIVVGSWAGFSIATGERTLRRVLLVTGIVALMVPLNALVVPRFALYQWIGLTDTLAPLIAPALMATSPFYVLMFAFSYSRVPRALYEAARLEGLSTLAVWRRIALPSSRPAMFGVAALVFGTHWGSFIEPLVYLSSPDDVTAALALRSLQALDAPNLPILLAGAVMFSAPAVLFFLAIQRALFKRTLNR